MMKLMAESVTVTWDWLPCGNVVLVNDKLQFPRVPAAPGVYRMVFQDDRGQLVGVYVGEADLLPRRLQHYRTPGPSQQTNLRLNLDLMNTLAANGRVMLEVAVIAQLVAADGTKAPLNLTWKAARVLVERAAEVGERIAGAPMLNK
jgi:hypothetical protein